VRRNSDTPILLLTAKGETEDRIWGLAAGADDYLAKPLEPTARVLRLTATSRSVPGLAEDAP
jgi:two-component system phosphate regulon response regulator OmpR